jgi:uncharacterized membrane protein
MAPNWLKDARFYALLLLWALCIASTVHSALLLPTLPNPMATHFSSSGDPNGYSSPQSFTALWIGLVWGMAVLFAASVWLSKTPVRWLNLPGKEELDEAGRLVPLLKSISTLLIINGSLIIAVLWAIFALTAIANLTQPVKLPSGAVLGPVIAIILAEVLLVAGMLGLVIKEQRNIPEGEGTTDSQASGLIREAN